VLSGQDDEELALKAVHQGVQDYLVKGAFDGKQLARSMHYAIERQAMLRTLEISRQQQLKFKNEFLSHVSHELRTPLTAIHQFTTILLDGLAGELGAEQREHLETILRSAQQLRSMIGDLLEATRAESGKVQIHPHCISMSEVIHQVLAMFRATAQEKRIGLEAGVDTRIPLVLADPERVRQVLINLIDNALKFTPGDGSVLVKACLVDADPDFVYISVADTGRGIHPEAKSLIFERLYQDPDSIDDSRKGLGLGLYIAKELVRLHGGRIWVESQLGHGSVFSFTLPLFSLPKLLTPLLGKKAMPSGPLSIVRVELCPSSEATASHWQELREQCLETLRLCIMPDKDVLLPSFAKAARSETFLIVACADAAGAEVLVKRIREQLAACTAWQAAAVAQVSFTSLPPAQPGGEASAPELLQSALANISAVIESALQQPITPQQPNDQPQEPVGIPKE
jgi:signal transduction histidine kinase